MTNQSKIEELRKAISASIKKQKMFIENEPEFSGHPLNTVVSEKTKETEVMSEESHKKD